MKKKYLKRERFIPSQLRYKIIDDLRLKKIYWWSKINITILYNNRISKNNKPLDNATNQPSKFRTRDWSEINDESKGKYDNSNIRFK